MSLPETLESLTARVQKVEAMELRLAQCEAALVAIVNKIGEFEKLGKQLEPVFAKLAPALGANKEAAKIFNFFGKKDKPNG